MENDQNEKFESELEKAIPEQIKQIRSALKEKHDIVIPSKCDEFIARCLRQKDGSLENATKLVMAFHDAITNLRQWDCKFLPSLGVEADKTGISIPLKKRDRHGHYIFVLRPGLWDPQQHNFEQAVAFLWMTLQFISAEYKDVQRNGFLLVYDFTGLSFQQALAINQRKLLSLGKWGHVMQVENGVVGRVKGIHLINHPTIMGLVYKGLKPFLKQKLKERVMLHDNVESLIEHVGSEYLPSFLGGALDPENCRDEVLVQRFLKSDKYFQDMLAAGFPEK